MVHLGCFVIQPLQVPIGTFKGHFRLDAKAPKQDTAKVISPQGCSHFRDLTHYQVIQALRHEHRYPELLSGCAGQPNSHQWLQTALELPHSFPCLHIFSNQCLQARNSTLLTAQSASLSTSNPLPAWRKHSRCRPAQWFGLGLVWFHRGSLSLLPSYSRANQTHLFPLP